MFAPGDATKTLSVSGFDAGDEPGGRGMKPVL